MEGVAFQSGAEGGGPGLLRDNAGEKKPVRIIPIPLGPGSRSSSTSEKCSGSLSFSLNGRLIPLPPAGAELKLHGHPGRSASGFTTVQDLVPVENTQNICRSACQTPPPPAHSTPVITAVVSGEAAERVFKTHSVTGSCTRPPQTTATPPHSNSPAAPTQLPLQGNLEPVSPPECQICRSQYKLVAELRGFMCLCSPALADSLNTLKKRKKQFLRRRRERYKVFRAVRERPSKACRPRPGPDRGPPDNKVLPPDLGRTHKLSDDLESEQLSSSASHEQPEPLHSPQGKLVIMVEDFYYGSTPQAPPTARRAAQSKSTSRYSCIHCLLTLYGNITLMRHMQEHVSNMSLPGQRPMCPQCFRYCMSPFQLRRHMEAVHQPAEPPAGTCKICELTFADEPAFLQHMKHTHRPGEMPYVCQVCDFRSSFYSELWSHFEQFHANTNHFLCRYCLKVLNSSTCYQQHFSIHQMKVTYSCTKCRLHFLFAKERLEHGRLHHRTHLRPAQLSGIKPGTKVTVRTYSAIRAPEEKGGGSVAPCKVVRVDLPSPTPEGPSKNLVESLEPLLFSGGLDSQADDEPPHAQRCLECLSSFVDFRTHFPSLVHCSLCRFTTCCSLAYANHMINTHTIGTRKPHYNSIFQSDPRLLQSLRCTVCALATHRGDVMANHLTEGQGHGCVVRTPDAARPPENCRGWSSSGQTGGSFIPIHLLPSRQRSSRLSVNVLPPPLCFSRPPAMTVKFLGAPPQCVGAPLSAFQQRVVCSALLHGVSQASRCHQTPQKTIHSWIRQQERHRSRAWYWSTEKLAEWLLVQREKQLSVSEQTLVQVASQVLGEAHQSSWYRWVLDFLLRHRLGVSGAAVGAGQPPCGNLPRSIVEKSRAFLELLSPQLLGKAPGLVASMDEIPIFINVERLKSQHPSALQLSGSASEPWTFAVVLAALADGSLLPPLLLCRGAACCIPDGFPDNVLLEARPHGFTDRDCQDVWIDKVWQPHTSAGGGSSHLLIADIHGGHLEAAFRSRLASLDTSLVFIPAGCSSCVQPLDVCVRPVLQDFLQARWNQLVSQGGLEALGLDQLALTLACWLSEVASILNAQTHFLSQSFSLVSSLKSVEREEEVARMLRDLGRVLLQPLDSLVLPSAQLVLIMQPEGRKEKKETPAEEQ